MGHRKVYKVGLQLQWSCYQFSFHHDTQVSKSLVEKLHDCFILKSFEEDAKLSDHCPIGLVLKL